MLSPISWAGKNGEFRWNCTAWTFTAATWCCSVPTVLQKWFLTRTSPPFSKGRKRPGVHANVNKNLKLPALDDYGISGYKASRSKIEELYAKIVTSSLDKMEVDALSCKELISKYGPILTEIPYEP